MFPEYIQDGKQQQNAFMSKKLQSQTSDKGFNESWQILRCSYKILKQQQMSEKRQILFSIITLSHFNFFFCSHLRLS